jgi:hypothetical protein
MMRLSVLLAIVMALIFCLGIALAHTQSDETAIRDFILPPADCPMPCWQGVRPGVTTVDEAASILQAHPWVERVTIEAQPLFHYLYWQWSAGAPAFVADPSARKPPYMWARDGIVQYITFPTRIPYAAVWSSMGKPDIGVFAVSGYRNPQILARTVSALHSAGYYGGLMIFDTRFFCPVNPKVFWGASVTVTLYNTRVTPLFSGRSRYDVIRWLYQRPCKTAASW